MPKIATYPVVTPAADDLLIGTNGTDGVTNNFTVASVGAVAIADHAALTTTAHGGIVASTDSRLTDSRAPTGAAGGVLSGTYPSPGFAADMATQAELDAHAASADPHPGYLTTAEGNAAYQPVDSDLTAIAALTTTAYGRAFLALADAAAARTATGAQAAVSQGRAKAGATQYYSIPGTEITTIATGGFGPANAVEYAPIFVAEALTIDQMAVEVTGAAAAGKTARLAIYNADTDWQPTSLVLDAGTVAIDSLGVKAASVSVVLPPGRYLSAINSDVATASFRLFRGGSRFMGMRAAMGGSPLSTFQTGTQTYGAFPGTGTLWTTDSGASLPPPHYIVYRVSAP